MQESLERTTADLIRIPSVSDRREECNRALEYVLESLGDPRGLTIHPFEHEGFRSLVITTHPNRRSRLILNAHLDVVWAREEQFEPVVRDGCLWGRGAYDMKGAAAVFVQVLREVAAMEPAERPDVQFQFVTDEEIGGHHGAELLVRQGFTADLFIAGEPTDLRICHRAKGVFWLKVRIPGAPGHSARPWLTRNPVVALQQGLGRLFERFPPPQQEVWHTTATPTYLEGGASHNRVPEEVVMKLDIRHIAEDTPEDILAFVETVFPGAEVEVVQRSYLLNTPAHDPLVQRIADLQERLLGLRPAFFSEHFASDARYWGNAGVPAICWGPGGAGMHADDERLELATLESYYRLVRQALFEL